MLGSGRSAPSFARGPGREEVAAAAPGGPSRHAEHQYEGFFRGLGATSREPVCGKRNSSLKQFHGAAHFAIGCQKWDEGPDAISTAHASFVDPGVAYACCDAPNGNSSAVELEHSRHDPTVHYRTEQRERFQNFGTPARDPPYRAQATVHLGDDRPDLVTQSKMVHGRLSPEEADRAAALRAAGAGTLVPTSFWPKPVRCDPINGGPRRVDNHDLGMATGMQFGRISQNSSAMVWEANARNPILGVHVPLKELAAPRAPNAPPPSTQVVAEANASVPHLRSLGALRPPV